uniref:Uncharacterized protein n=1 Tax=Astatotilapia calliptera TaxID=8154 RepID=A0A3P8PQF9_ASTCA
MLCSINVAMNYGWILLIFYLYVVTKQIYRFGISYRLLHLRWLFCPAQDGAPGAPSSGLAVLLSIQQLLLPSYSPYGSSICGGHRPYSYSYGGGCSLGGYRHTPHLEDIPPAGLCSRLKRWNSKHSHIHMSTFCCFERCTQHRTVAAGANLTNKLGTIAPYAISYFKSVRKSRRTCFWLRPVKIMNVFHSVSLLGLDTNWASEEDNHVVARGEYDFTAASQEELSMRAGEMLNLAPKGDELFTSYEGSSFVYHRLVPANYVKILSSQLDVTDHVTVAKRIKHRQSASEAVCWCFLTHAPERQLQAGHH